MPGLCALVGVCAATQPQLARANFPPVAGASAQPQEALVGETIQFSAASSFDPDDGPEPLSFSWDFGDGTQSALAEPTHSYDALGLFVVTLTVSDGQAQSLVSLDVVTLAPPSPVPPARSSTIAVSPNDQQVAVVNPDASSISLLDAQSLLVQEVDVGARPRTVAWIQDGAAVLVACQDSDELWVLGTDGSLLDVIPTDREPSGVAVSPADGRIVVSHEGSATVAVLAPDTYEVLSGTDVGATPRAIAIPPGGDRAYVTHFVTSGEVGQVSVVDLFAGGVLDVVTLAEDAGPDGSTSGRGFVSLLGGVAIEPALGNLWVGGQKSNTGRGMFLSGEELQPRNRIRGLLAPVDLQTELELPEERIDTNDADSVSAIAFSPRGRYVYLTHPGAGQLSVYDLPAAALVDDADGDVVNFTARVDVGDAPQGVAVSSDGSRAFVMVELSRSVAVFDLADQGDPQLIDTVSVTDETLEPVVARGKVLFHRSREPVHSDQNYIACAGCHPDGGHDGRTWDFTQYGEGLRNTIDLRGHGGMDHGPVHWSANFDEIQDFENDIQFGFGGEGLLGDGAVPHPPLDAMKNAGRSDDLDALAAYVASLRTPPRSPYREADGSLSEAAQRGLEIFFDETVACASCHVPPRFTDSTLTDDPADYVLHDVGTLGEGSGQRLGGPLPGIDTPTVLGVWASPPYLHDGSAPTLRDVLTTRNLADQHGTTSHLSGAEIDDLIAYLRSLQGSDDEYPAPPEGGTSSTGGSSGGGAGTTGGPMTSGGDDGSSTGFESWTSGDDAGSTEQAGEDGCGCRSGSGPRGAASLLLWLALGMRRRRRS